MPLPVQYAAREGDYLPILTHIREFTFICLGYPLASKHETDASSIVGSHPVPGALLYASTKGAIETLTRGLALELAPRKIRVNAIAPGHTETEGNLAAGTFEGGAGAVLAGKMPLGRLGRVTDIAPLAVFLASDESAWITGEVIRAAGGLVVAT
jgi:3-oxoacyl-[acyl-carrier protein] reductase